MPNDEKYEEFYQRAFTGQNVKEIYALGGGTSFRNFLYVSRGNVKDKGYYDAMFAHTSRKGNLGRQIYERYFKQENIAQNKSNRPIVRKGYRIDYVGKTYKGGQFLPKSYFQNL